MSQSLKEQISNKCKHFNGIMSKSCTAGVDYDNVKVGRPIQLPCLKTGGECTKAEFRTEDEVEKELAEVYKFTNETIGVMVMVKSHYAKTKENPGKLKCSCGGELYYAMAESNGHFRAKCKSCGISFME